MFSAFNHPGVSQPYLPASAVAALRRLIDSAAGQTPFGQALNGPVRALECAQTARDIEVDLLRQHIDQLSRENELLKCQITQERSEELRGGEHRPEGPQEDVRETHGEEMGRKDA
jgi:hypothetical protein